MTLKSWVEPGDKGTNSLYAPVNWAWIMLIVNYVNHQHNPNPLVHANKFVAALLVGGKPVAVIGYTQSSVWLLVYYSA